MHVAFIASLFLSLFWFLFGFIVVNVYRCGVVKSCWFERLIFSFVEIFNVELLLKQKIMFSQI